MIPDVSVDHRLNHRLDYAAEVAHRLRARFGRNRYRAYELLELDRISERETAEELNVHRRTARRWADAVKAEVERLRSQHN